MALSDPIPVRFSAGADQGLADISGKTGMSKAELVRIAVSEFLVRVAETGEIVQRIQVMAETPPPSVHQNQVGNGVNTQSVNYATKPKKPKKPKKP
jgi:hypothetical protein